MPDPGTVTFAADDVLRLADEARARAAAALRQADLLHRAALRGVGDPHARGRIRQKLWEDGRHAVRPSLYFSEAGQDRFVHRSFFADKRDGTFVEVGGYDGVTGSNCLFFELALGWRGLLAEPAPGPFRKAAALRRCACVRTAVADAEGEVEFVDVTGGYRQMSGLLGSHDPALLERVRRNPAHREEVVRVPVTRLASLLEAHGLSAVDYCSLDVEGAELSILATFPFDRFEVRVWSVENASAARDIRSLMHSRGYKLVDIIGADEIYCLA